MGLWVFMLITFIVEVISVIVTGDFKIFFIVLGATLVYVGIGILYARLYFNEPDRKYYGRRDQKEHDAKEVGFRFLFWPLIIPWDLILDILPMVSNRICESIGELVCDFLGKGEKEDSTGLKDIATEQVLQEEK